MNWPACARPRAPTGAFPGGGSLGLLDRVLCLARAHAPLEIGVDELLANFGMEIKGLVVRFLQRLMGPGEQNAARGWVGLDETDHVIHDRREMRIFRVAVVVDGVLERIALGAEPLLEALLLIALVILSLALAGSLRLLKLGDLLAQGQHGRVFPFRLGGRLGIGRGLLSWGLTPEQLLRREARLGDDGLDETDRIPVERVVLLV